MTVRSAVPGDAAAVARIDNASFRDAWSADYYRDETKNPLARLLVAEYGGSLCGFLLSWFVPPQAEFLRMAVAVECRKQGIAQGLIQALQTRARREGIQQVFLEVRPLNQPARSLYERCGFVVTRRRPGYYRNPVEDAICMEWRDVSAGKNPDRP